METRRQWLQKNPRPKSPVNLQALLEDEKRRLLFSPKDGEIQKRVNGLTNEIAAAAKCPVHQTGLHHHRNRPEDLYICESGPHFLFWTQKNGQPALIPVDTLLLPELDAPMTEGTAIPNAEKK